MILLLELLVLLLAAATATATTVTATTAVGRPFRATAVIQTDYIYQEVELQ